MRICKQCGRDWPTKKKFPFKWKNKCKCGSKDYEFSSKDKTITSNNPIYDG